jgi:hypothetical protein
VREGRTKASARALEIADIARARRWFEIADIAGDRRAF